KAQRALAAQEAQQGMRCIVAIELGFLKGKQIRLFFKDFDATLKSRERDLRNQDAVKFLDQVGPGAFFHERLQTRFIDFTDVADDAAHFTDDRIERLKISA